MVTPGAGRPLAPPPLSDATGLNAVTAGIVINKSMNTRHTGCLLVRSIISSVLYQQIKRIRFITAVYIASKTREILFTVFNVLLLKLFV